MPDLKYPAVQQLIARQAKRHSTETKAFLAWVLENIYRLDESDADDCVCDGPDDKGVDGLYVHELDQTIQVFQCKLYQNQARTVGDSALRNLGGALAQFQSPQAVEQIVANTANPQLVGRINELKIAELLKQDYGIRGVFVTNAQIDQNGRTYLGANPTLSTISEKEIDALYVPPDRQAPQTGQFDFDVSQTGFISYTTPQGIDVAIAPISAKQLATLPGIENGALFEPNLRQSLGLTKINKEIVASIKDRSEHGQFLLYHNGITMVCENLHVDPKTQTLTAKNIFVVNGCQSLTSLFDQKSNLSDDLKIMVKLVEVGKDSELLDKITYRSNNQNVIKPRDFKSNNPIQVRLQNEFKKLFKGDVFYRIKRGETTSAPTIIDNELAAKILLSFDLRQPWSAHQKYKLFDELYRDIFSRPEVDTARVYTIYLIYEWVCQMMGDINDKLFANYALSQFFVLYLVAEALDSSEVGRDFIAHPEKYILVKGGTDALQTCIGDMLKDLIVDLNGELDERRTAGNPLDFKRELKSATAVPKLARTIVGGYQKQVSRGRIPSFADDWASALAKP